MSLTENLVENYIRGDYMCIYFSTENDIKRGCVFYLKVDISCKIDFSEL